MPEAKRYAENANQPTYVAAGEVEKKQQLLLEILLLNPAARIHQGQSHICQSFLNASGEVALGNSRLREKKNQEGGSYPPRYPR